MPLLTSRPRVVTASSGKATPWGLTRRRGDDDEPAELGAGLAGRAAQVTHECPHDEEQDDIDEREEEQADDPQAEVEDIHQVVERSSTRRRVAPMRISSPTDRHLADGRAVDQGAVAAAEVDEHECPLADLQASVTARDAAVDKDDVVRRVASDAQPATVDDHDPVAAVGVQDAESSERTDDPRRSVDPRRVAQVIRVGDPVDRSRQTRVGTVVELGVRTRRRRRRDHSRRMLGVEASLDRDIATGDLRVWHEVDARASEEAVAMAPREPECSVGEIGGQRRPGAVEPGDVGRIESDEVSVGNDGALGGRPTAGLHRPFDLPQDLDGFEANVSVSPRTLE